MTRRGGGSAAIVAAALLIGAAGPAAGSEEVWPMPDWAKAAPADVGMDGAPLEKARDYALTGGGSGCIVRRGRMVLAWGDLKQRYDLKSTTKSIGMTAVGLAVADGKLSLSDPAARHHPSFGSPPAANLQTGWVERITLFHLATHTAGFEKPGGYTRLLFEPGTKWAYSDGGPNWLAECVTLAYRRDVAELLAERVFAPLGIGAGDLVWRQNAYRPARIDGIVRREFGSGISACADAMARLGLLYLREGRWQDRRILPKEFVAAVRSTPEALKGLPVVQGDTYPEASNHYGLLWWNNADGALPGVPRDAYWSWGLHDSLIVVLPGLDVVAVRAGKDWAAAGCSHYGRLAPFLAPIAASVRRGGADAAP